MALSRAPRLLRPSPTTSMASASPPPPTPKTSGTLARQPGTPRSPRRRILTARFARADVRSSLEVTLVAASWRQTTVCALLDALAGALAANLENRHRMCRQVHFVHSSRLRNRVQDVREWQRLRLLPQQGQGWMRGFAGNEGGGW